MWESVCESMESVTTSDQPSAFCKALDFLHESVSDMHIDTVNARLCLNTPVIKRHSDYYECCKFSKNLQNVCMLTFGVCQEWMYKTTLHKVASSGVDLERLLKGSASCFIKVHTAAILVLVISPAEYQVPETLGFNKHQLGLFGTEFSYLSVLSAMLIIVAKVLCCINCGLKVVSHSWTFPEALFPPQVPLTLMKMLAGDEHCARDVCGGGCARDERQASGNGHLPGLEGHWHAPSFCGGALGSPAPVFHCF